MLLSFIATNIHYFLERIPKKSQQVQVNESTGQQVNEFFLGGADKSDESDGRTPYQITKRRWYRLNFFNFLTSLTSIKIF